MELIFAASSCDPESQIICTPASVNELFALPFLGGINRPMIGHGEACSHRRSGAADSCDTAPQSSADNDLSNCGDSLRIPHSDRAGLHGCPTP